MQQDRQLPGCRAKQLCQLRLALGGSSLASAGRRVLLLELQGSERRLGKGPAVGAMHRVLAPCTVCCLGYIAAASHHYSTTVEQVLALPSATCAPCEAESHWGPH